MSNYLSDMMNLLDYEIKCNRTNSRSTTPYSVLQMSAYSFAKQKTIRVRVWGFHFAVGKMKTAIFSNCEAVNKRH